MGFQAGRSLPGPTAMLRGSEWPFPAEGQRREFLLPFFAESRLGEFDLPPHSPDVGLCLTYLTSLSWGSQPGGSGQETRRSVAGSSCLAGHRSLTWQVVDGPHLARGQVCRFDFHFFLRNGSFSSLLNFTERKKKERKAGIASPQWICSANAPSGPWAIPAFPRLVISTRHVLRCLLRSTVYRNRILDLR